MATIRCPLYEASSVAPQEAFCYDGMRRHTYYETEGRVQDLRARLAESGLQRGQRMAVCLPNSYELVVLLFAVWRCGASVLLISPRLPVSERAWQAEAVGVDLQIGVDVEEPDVGSVGGILQDLNGNAGEIQPPVYTLNDACTVLYTSGSSGRPKAAVLPFRTHYYNARGANRCHKIGRGDIWLMSLPLFHVGGLGILFRTVMGGGGLAIPSPGEPLAEEISLFNATHVSVVPTQLRRLLDGADVSDLADQLKVVLLGGAPSEDGLVREARARNLPVFKTWGMTEAGSQVTTVGTVSHAGCELSSGKVLPHREVRVDTQGQLWVKGPILFDGYLDKGAVSHPFDADGWYPTGDTGRIDEQGYVWVEGRQDLMFISGGENIQPEEIEAVFHDHLGVTAVVVPVDDAEFGKRPFAFVEGLPLDAAGAGVVEQLALRLEEYIPRFKVPVGFHAMPRGQDGQLKVDRVGLQELAATLYTA